MMPEVVPARAGVVTSDIARDPVRVGEVLARSGYFKDAREAAQAAVKVMAGQELGIGPVASMTGIHIVEGKPTLGAHLLAGLVKGSVAYDYRVSELTAERCVLAFYERGEHVGDSEFSIEDGRTAGVGSRGPWKTYPRNMLFARAISNGIRFYCPDLTSGAPVYTAEELGVEVEGPHGVPVESASAAEIEMPPHDESDEARELDDSNARAMRALGFPAGKVAATHNAARTLDEKQALAQRLNDALDAQGGGAD